MTASSPCIYSLIALKGSNLHIGQHIVALHGRKKTKLLLEAMLSQSREGLRMEVLVSSSADPAVF